MTFLRTFWHFFKSLTFFERLKNFWLFFELFDIFLKVWHFSKSWKIFDFFSNFLTLVRNRLIWSSLITTQSRESSHSNEDFSSLHQQKKLDTNILHAYALHDEPQWNIWPTTRRYWPPYPSLVMNKKNWIPTFFAHMLFMTNHNETFGRRLADIDHHTHL